MNKSRLNMKSGFTLLEILVALGIFSFVATGVLSFSAWIIQSVQTEASKADRNVENLEMLKLFTQPIYFGALSKFQENSQLKACMTTDTVLCDSSKEYPVTPFDLATNKALDTASSSKDSNIKNQVSFKVHCPNNETSCDKADYFTVIVKTYLDYHGFDFSKIEKKGIVTPEFNNVVTYVPDSALAPGRPINIIMFLDNSNSMAFAKDQIKNSLDTLLTKISTMDATLGIYTLSSSMAGKSSYYTLDGSGNKVPLASPWGKPAGFTYYELTTYPAYYYYTYANQDPSYFLSTTYPIYRVFNFLSTDSDSVRATKISSVKNLVESLFANPSSNLDAPLCNMLRMLEMPGTTSPFKFDPITPTAMFVISNEDDESKAGPYYQDGCERYHVTKWSINSDYYHYYGYLQNLKLNIEANGTMDGAPYIGKATFSYQVPYDAARAPGTDCLEEANAIPIQQVENAFIKWRQQYVSSWSYKPGDGITIKKCVNDVKLTWVISTANKTPQDYCNQLAAGTYKGTVPPAYVPNSCYEVVSKAGSGSSGGVIETNTLFSNTVGIVDTLYASMQNHFSLENFYYTAVVHPDVTTCTITPGSQVGTRYINLAKKPGLKSSVIPVCSGNYAAQLDKIIQWTQSLGANDIQLTPSVAANMSGVEIVRSGTTIKLAANVDYQLSGTVLIFKTGLLLPNDLIKVYLK